MGAWLSHEHPSLPVLPGIEVLNILAECDDNGASLRAIQVTAERWLNVGRDIFVYMPPAGDMNDALIAYRTHHLSGLGR
jgi:hypothetical protein